MKFFTVNRLMIAVCAVLLTTFLFSCQKESSSFESNATTPTEEQSALYADESTQAEASFDDAEDIGMTAAEEEGAVSVYGRGQDLPFSVSFEELRLRIGLCAEVTITPNDNSYPKTITIDFGDGCWGVDGKFRKGAIIVHLTGPIRRSGSVLTLTFRNFYLNRAHMEGTKVVSNLSANGQVKFTVQVTGGKLSLPNGRGYVYNGLKYVKQIAGETTRIVRDDIYTIEGRSKTEFNGGLVITLNTETPLLKKVACPWINEGLLKIVINDRHFLLNYAAPSNGDCDNKAMLSWNSGANQRLISLP